jgi:hypothetical protein
VAFSTRDAALGADAGAAPTTAPDGYIPTAPATPRAGRARVPATPRRKAGGNHLLRPPAPILAKRVCGKIGGGLAERRGSRLFPVKN